MRSPFLKIFCDGRGSSAAKSLALSLSPSLFLTAKQMRIVIVFGIDALQKNIVYHDYLFSDSFVFH